VAANNGAAVRCEPLRREYCANFRDSFRYDPASKAGRTEPKGKGLKPDIFIREIRGAGTTEPPKYWSTVIGVGVANETADNNIQQLASQGKGNPAGPVRLPPWPR
jgi:hypothetical protein